MNPKAIYAIVMVYVGCGLNNVFLEYLIKLDPGAGPLLTFSQFLFIAIHGFIFTSKFGTVQPSISRKYYVILVVMLFASSILNNWAFNFNIPVPLHMIFSSGSLITNLFMGAFVLKKKYSDDKYISVIMITLGISICSIAYAGQGRTTFCRDCDVNASVGEIGSEDPDHFFWWLIGIFLLTSALLLSARMGIYQETLYQTHGKYPSEALYYTHIFSLPGFIIYASSIWDHVITANNSKLYEVPLIHLVIPLYWIFLILNVITQYICISSVFILTTECTSLTVTLIVTLRKFMSLIISIVYFQNPFSEAQWFGTFLVFLGTLIFTEIISTEKSSLIV